MPEREAFKSDEAKEWLEKYANAKFDEKWDAALCHIKAQHVSLDYNILAL